MPDKCPFCNGVFGCIYYDGKSWNPGHLHEDWNRSYKCYERQIAALQAKLELWREAAEFVDDCQQYNVSHLTQVAAQKLWNRLKDAGEVA